jgi:hypothetical protein
VGKLKSANGQEANKLQPSDRPVHEWYRFVLSFPPHLVREYLNRFAIATSHCVLDPFCGTGTTLVECKKRGIAGVGIEANPIAHLASQVKVDWTPDPDKLTEHAQEVADLARMELASEGLVDDPTVPLFGRALVGPNSRRCRLRKLAPELNKLILTDSISPLPLHKTLVLLERLTRCCHADFHCHELLALAKALVFSIGNLHFGPEVGVGRLKGDAPVISAWLSDVETMARDLRNLRGKGKIPSRIHRGDARRVGQLLDARSIDAVITSPPYPNEKDYTRTTRLESVLLGFVRGKADLRALKSQLVRSNTRGVYKWDNDDLLVANHPKILQVAEAIEARRIEMGKTSGFERLYHRVTKLYFGGMARHLAELRPALRPGCRLAYVVGDQASYLRVMIRTGQLLGDIAQSLGYELESIDLFRTRLATATKEQLREEVVVLRWPG